MSFFSCSEKEVAKHGVNQATWCSSRVRELGSASAAASASASRAGLGPVQLEARIDRTLRRCCPAPEPVVGLDPPTSAPWLFHVLRQVSGSAQSLPGACGSSELVSRGAANRTRREFWILLTTSRLSSPCSSRSSARWFSVRQSRGVLPGSHVHPRATAPAEGPGPGSGPASAGACSGACRAAGAPRSPAAAPAAPPAQSRRDTGGAAGAASLTPRGRRTCASSRYSASSMLLRLLHAPQTRIHGLRDFFD